MANNVALSQDEVDKLLGITTKGSAPKVEKKTYKVENFLSEDDFQQIRLVCKSTYKYLTCFPTMIWLIRLNFKMPVFLLSWIPVFLLLFQAFPQKKRARSTFFRARFLRTM